MKHLAENFREYEIVALLRLEKFVFLRWREELVQSFLLPAITKIIADRNSGRLFSFPGPILRRSPSSTVAERIPRLGKLSSLASVGEEMGRMKFPMISCCPED